MTDVNIGQCYLQRDFRKKRTNQTVNFKMKRIKVVGPQRSSGKFVICFVKTVMAASSWQKFHRFDATMLFIYREHRTVNRSIDMSCKSPARVVLFEIYLFENLCLWSTIWVIWNLQFVRKWFLYKVAYRYRAACTTDQSSCGKLLSLCMCNNMCTDMTCVAYHVCVLDV